jgi:hypothetical protein
LTKKWKQPSAGASAPQKVNSSGTARVESWKGRGNVRALRRLQKKREPNVTEKDSLLEIERLINASLAIIEKARRAPRGESK